MRAMHYFTVGAVLALVVAGAAQGAAGRGKPFQSMRPYVAVGATAASCDLGPTTSLCIPVDSTFTVAVFSDSSCGVVNLADPCSRNDDSFTAGIDLPFTFHLYGQGYTRIYLNNNGNLSFGTGYCEFSSLGFPVSGFPIVAPFWADIDTRHPASGVVHYRLDPHKLVVAWDHVGYFDQQGDMLNTFEVILSDGTDPAVSPGNNVCFCYGDMQWTTGSASDGVGGFAGIPATVGVNAGDGIHFFQIGRFDHAGTDYDGPGGANDGVDYLDNQRFCANIGGQNIPPVAIGFRASMVDSVFVGDSLVVSTSFAAPELDQTTVTSVDLGGLANATVSTISGNLSTQRLVFHPSASQVGAHAVRYVAVDDGIPADTTIVNFAIVVASHSRCLPTNHAPQFVPPTPACGDTVQAFANQAMTLQVYAADAESQDIVTLAARGIPGGAVLAAALPATGNPVGTTVSWTPAAADVGLRLVTFRAGDGCDSTTCTIAIRVMALAACPRSAEAWAEHRPAWPANRLRLGNVIYDGLGLARILGAERHGRREREADMATLRLARQLVATKFNRLIGAGAPDIDSLVARVDSLIGDHVLPYEIQCGGRDGAGEPAGGVEVRGPSPNGHGGNDCALLLRQIKQATDTLVQFNGGQLSPGCHGDRHHADGGDDEERARPAVPDALAAGEAGAQASAPTFSVDARPNPFRGVTTIAYMLPSGANVRIALYDLQGREVRVLADGHMVAGSHVASWDGTDASGQRLRSGVYFYRVTAGPYTSGKKLIVQQ